MDEQLRADLNGVARAQAALVTALGVDFDPAQPSRLPEWTVGHLLTHIARNAEGFTRVFTAAAAGAVAEMYPEGPGGRAAAIEAGAGRDREALVADVAGTGAALHEAMAAVPDPVWATGRARTLAGVRTLPQCVLGRWREVEIHRADLGFLGDWRDWPEGFVARMLPVRLVELGDHAPALAGPDGHVLAHLFGRTVLPGAAPVAY